MTSIKKIIGAAVRKVFKRSRGEIHSNGGKKSRLQVAHFGSVGDLYLDYKGKDTAVLLVHLAGPCLAPQLSPSSIFS